MNFKVNVIRNTGTRENPVLVTTSTPLEIVDGDANLASAYNATRKVFDSDPTIFVAWFDGDGNSGFTGFGPRWSVVSANIREGS